MVGGRFVACSPVEYMKNSNNIVVSRKLWSNLAEEQEQVVLDNFVVACLWAKDSMFHRIEIDVV